MSELDPRLNAIRPDLAARHLEGRVSARRFSEGQPAHVISAVAPIRQSPRHDAGLDTEALRGEAITVYDEDSEGWSWVQLARDGYVGYIPSQAILKGARPEANYKVAALRSFEFSGPSIKEPPLDWLSLGSELQITREIEARGRRFGVTTSGGCVVLGHLAPIDALETDPVGVAERFVGTPYLWGGKSSLGLDCSGLVQTALRAVGVLAPRDTDMQEKVVGSPISLDPAEWRRGDLVFWPGHVAYVRDRSTLLHANAHHMAVAIEDTAAALARIAASDGPPSSARRL
jgi:hypothetical protein